MKNFIENYIQNLGSSNIKNTQHQVDNLNLTRSELKNNIPKISSKTDLLITKEDVFLSFDSYDEMEEILEDKNRNWKENKYQESDLNVQPLTKQVIDEEYEIIKDDRLNKKFRRCRYCLLIKVKLFYIIQPERTHHCRLCKKCVRVYDHHCFILNNCIGVSNFKFFINFLVYTVVLLIFTNLSMLRGLSICFLENGFISVRFFVFSSAIAINTIAVVFTSYILYIQLWLMSNDMTMHEYKTHKRKMVF